MQLWYDEADAPAPHGTVEAGTEVPVTVGIQPEDTSNRIEVLYRVNGGPAESVLARWLRNDSSRNIQYFQARLPAIEAGDTVEYTPICRCAGRQVPSPEESQEFASSFRVVGAEAQPIRATTSTTAE